MTNFIEDLRNNKRQLAVLAIWIGVFSLVAHGFCYFNEFFSHDSLLVCQNDTEWEISIGRFLNPVYVMLRGRLFPPVIIGLLVAAYQTATAYLIVKLFDIKSREAQVAVCGVLATNATITLLNATYINYSDIFMLSLLLAVAGAYCIRCGNSWKNYAAAIALFVLSMGLYQSYLQVAVTLLMLLAILDLMDGKEGAVRKGLAEAGALMASIVIYFAASRAVLAVMGINEATSYNAVGGIGHNIGAIPEAIAGAYLYVFDYFMHPSIFHKKLVAIITVALVCWCVCWIFTKARKNHIPKANYAWMIALFALLPFGMNYIYVITNGMEHNLMIFSFFMLYVLAAVIADRTELKRDRVIAIALLMAFVACGILFSNRTYLQKEMEAKSTLSLMTRVVDRIENTEGYDIDTTQIVFVCDPYRTNWTGHQKTAFNYEDVGLQSSTSVTEYNTYAQYLEYVLGYRPHVASKEEAEAFIEAHEEVIAEIKMWPSKEAVQFVDGVLVVKMQ